MHILLEEAPLLVYYFLTLFLSNYKLRLSLSIFSTTSTFCQLELPCSICSLRSLDAHLLTHFVLSLCSLIAHSLRSFARLLRIVPSISLATSEFAFRFALYNFRSTDALRNSFIKVHSLRQIRLYHHFVSNSFVQSLCSKKFFHKIVKCAGTPVLSNCFTI